MTRRYLGKNLGRLRDDRDVQGPQPRPPGYREPVPAAAAEDEDGEDPEDEDGEEDDVDDVVADHEDDDDSGDETDDDEDDSGSDTPAPQVAAPVPAPLGQARPRIGKKRNVSRERRKRELKQLRLETRLKKEAEEDERLHQLQRAAAGFAPVNSLDPRRRADELLWIDLDAERPKPVPSLGEVLQRRKRSAGRPAEDPDPLRRQGVAEQLRAAAHPKSEAKEVEVKEDPRPFADPFENDDWIESVWPDDPDDDPDAEELRARYDALHRQHVEATAMRAAHRTGLPPGKTPAQKKREAEMARRRKVAGGGPAGLHKERPRGGLPQNRINAPRPIAKGGVRRHLAKKEAGLKAKARAEVEKMLSPKNMEGLHQRPVNLAKYSMDLLIELHLFAFIREGVTRHGETLFYLVRSDRKGKAGNLISGRYSSRGKALLKMHDTLLSKYGTAAAALENWEKMYRRKEERPRGGSGPSSAAGK
jgi:hypothetical protein